MKKLSDKSVVEAYFDAFSKADMDRVLEIFHPDCLIVSVKEGERAPGQLHGSYQGREEARQFLANIASLFITKSFQIDAIMEGHDHVVYANGDFTHEVKATGKLFYSTWVQRCIIEEGMIKEYRFYEDSAAYERAAS